MKADLGLRGKLVALVITAIIPILGWSLYQAWVDSEADLETARSNVKLAAALGAANQDRIAEGARQLLTAIGHVANIATNDRAQCAEYLKQLRAQFPVYVNLGVTDANGVIRCDTADNTGKIDVSNQPFFKLAFSGGRFAVGSYAVGRLSNRPVLTFAYPLTGTGGSLAGIVFASLDLSQKSALINVAELPSGSRVTILDRNQRVLSTTDSNLKLGEPLPAIPATRKTPSALNAEITVGEVGDRWTGRIVALAPVLQSGQAAFYVAASADKQSILEPTRASLTRGLIGVLVMSMAGATLAWFFGGRAIVGPTKQILAATNALREGRLETRIPDIHTTAATEFVRIAKGVNDMAEALEEWRRQSVAELQRSAQTNKQLEASAQENAALFREIKQLNEHLEVKVFERTQALARQEALFRALAEESPQLVWTTDAQGKINFLNNNASQLSLPPGRMLLGEQWQHIMHADDVADFEARWSEARRTLTPFAGTRHLRWIDGVNRTTAYSASPVFDGGGDLSFWVGIDTDITDLKTAEAALQLSNLELEAFSYSVSHDLRSPLSSISGFCAILAKRPALQEDIKAAEFLSRIQRAATQMSLLIDGLLLLAQVSRKPLKLESVDVSAMAEEILERLGRLTPQREAAIKVEPGLTAHADKRMLHSVFENLLGNAWKFCSRLQRTEISVGGFVDESGETVFFVRDNGAGFDMAYADKLFGTFERLHTESEFPGTGVGLATVKRIVVRHGGWIQVESAVGAGTTFRFTLGRVT